MRELKVWNATLFERKDTSIYCNDLFLQGEYSVKLEMSNCTVEDKGTYKLIAKNEKGEAQSQTVTITEIPGNAPAIAEKLQSVVSQIWFFRNLSKLECQSLRIFFSIIFAHIHAGSSMLLQ